MPKVKATRNSCQLTLHGHANSEPSGIRVGDKKPNFKTENGSHVLTLTNLNDDVIKIIASKIEFSDMLNLRKAGKKFFECITNSELAKAWVNKCSGWDKIKEQIGSQTKGELLSWLKLFIQDEDELREVTNEKNIYSPYLFYFKICELRSKSERFNLTRKAIFYGERFNISQDCRHFVREIGDDNIDTRLYTQNKEGSWQQSNTCSMTAIYFSFDSRHLISHQKPNDDNSIESVKIYSLEKGEWKEKSTISNQQYLFSQFTSDSRYFFIQFTDILEIFGVTESNEWERIIGLDTSSVFSYIYRPSTISSYGDNMIIASGSEGAEVKIYDLKTGLFRVIGQGIGCPELMAVSKHGRYLMALYGVMHQEDACEQRKHNAIIYSQKENGEWEIEFNAVVFNHTQLTFSPDERYLITFHNNEMKIHNLLTSAVQKKNVDVSPGYPPTFSPNSRYFIHCKHNEVIIYGLKEGVWENIITTAIEPFGTAENFIKSAVFSPDSRNLMLRSAANIIKMYTLDVESFQEYEIFKYKSALIKNFNFSLDSRLFVFVSINKREGSKKYIYCRVGSSWVNKSTTAVYESITKCDFTVDSRSLVTLGKSQLLIEDIGRDTDECQKKFCSLQVRAL